MMMLNLGEIMFIYDDVLMS